MFSYPSRLRGGTNTAVVPQARVDVRRRPAIADRQSTL